VKRLRLAFVFGCVLAGTLAIEPARAATVPPPLLVRHGAVTIVTQPDSSASLAGVVLFAPAGLDRQSLTQNGLAALTAESILRTPVAPSVALEDAIAARGGAISFEVDARDVRFYVEGTGATEPALLDLFERALAKPEFSARTLSEARERLDQRIAANQQVALKVGMEMLERQSPGAPNVGMPEFGTPISLAQLVPSDLQNFYARAYRRDGDIISAAGALEGLPSGTLDRLAQTLQPGVSAPVVMKIPELRGASRQLVTHRNIAAPWLVAQYRAPALSSRDFGAMLVLSAFINRTLAEVADVPSLVSRSLTDRAIGTIYNFDAQPASMVVFVDGGLGDPSHTFGATLAVMHVIESTRVQGSITPFKAAAAGRFIEDTTSIADRAWIAGVFAQQGGSGDYVSATLAAILAVTPTDLQRVARLYLGDPVFAVVLPREGA
jgi:predicted Zn-dependent peptidase